MTVLNLGCADDHHADAINVDANPAADPDVLADLSERWPFSSDSIEHIRAYHVLEHLPSVTHALSEGARVLVPYGSIEVRWPVGMNERADPDHKHTWVWDTPEMYTGARQWDTDLPLRVEHRDVTLHSHAPGNWSGLHTKLLSAALSHFGPGRWAFDQPVTSGEFTVVFRHEP